MTPKQIAHLQKSALFAGIEPAEYQRLINCLAPHAKTYKSNEIILLTGNPVTHIGIILWGTACAYLEHKDGSQTLISNLLPRNTFGEVLVSTKNHKSPVTIYAGAAEIAVAFIEYDRIFATCTAACAAHRIFLQNMLKVIGDKYFLLFDRINILRDNSLRARIMAYLHTLSDGGTVTEVTIPFTKTMLASYLMVNRSALSKELRKMENDGLIAVDGRKIEILRV